MYATTLFTWILLIFGAVFILLPMIYAESLMVFRPNSRQTKNIIIGKEEDWRDKTHFNMSYGVAWADLIVWLPLLIAGMIGVILEQAWGYALWTVAGAISVYINIIFWFSERKYVYKSCGPLVYYTIFWGFFIYWGLAVIVYSILRLSGVFI